MKKIFAFVLSIIMAVACMAACSPSNPAPASDADGKTVKVGICNYVDDASLNQIVENIQARLKEIGDEKGVAFDVSYDNCNADANLLTQIISNFIADDVDIMIGVATPVAMAMQAATEDNGIPVVFAAVSDPVGAGLVESMEAPGSNVTGTSDYLDTAAVMQLITAADPDVKNVALLYDIGQDSSTAAIAHAKEYLDANGIAYGEYTGTTVDEVTLAVQALIADGVDAVFTPTDNTIMKSELSIYEMLQEAGIPHYTGADSFALNGAFLGYGVDYAALGVETANMAASIALDGAKPAETAVKTFDNGCATINTETCEKLGFNYDEICKAFEPFCTKTQSIVTAESFDEVK
ncbi:MAG: ABC transporter substrate-binding protein [Eubacteriales bacterium]|nr:ABC transporter substrate-binding protein [Christensenellaceae bacterium]MDY3976208.1 ABC transporter substrate-binding protein [Eubacteriales bacterium]MDY5717918.1 ABC transporter substrate-binding protein [Eubacteriales bacterium]